MSHCGLVHGLLIQAGYKEDSSTREAVSLIRSVIRDALAAAPNAQEKK